MQGEDGPRFDLATLGVDATDGYETFESALDEGTGTVAVVAAPYAGRDTVLGFAVEQTGADRVDLDPGDEAPEVPDSGALVVTGCHHLFERRVGGFDRLDAFLGRVAASDALVVTGWNRYAWGYLALAREADRPFDTTLALPGVDAEALATLVDREGTPATPVADEVGAVRPFERAETTLSVRGRSVTLPYPRPNREYLLAQQAADDPPETAVFEQLERVSNGNPGVALAVWDRAVGEADTVSPTDLTDPVSGADLTASEAFCLRIVLAKRRVVREELARVAAADAATLRALSRAGFVERDGTVQLRPEAVPRAAALTERRRFA
ncbi:hypothetical protein [Halorarius litoreus]|uniref:hypothetical protein n=1 Tax=Halorarius litoreus TaxID=2962676 RepID=UPI0020CD0A06|nr:hypothetical protein [Halorarius litoreus]